jgi:hypothetical protein
VIFVCFVDGTGLVVSTALLAPLARFSAPEPLVWARGRALRAPVPRSQSHTAGKSQGGVAIAAFAKRDQALLDCSFK